MIHFYFQLIRYCYIASVHGFTVEQKTLLKLSTQMLVLPMHSNLNETEQDNIAVHVTI